jgi:hypothetical protein
MFEEYELPQPDDLAGLDDVELVDAIKAATLMEIVAIDLRLAAMHEMHARQLRARPTTRPTPQRKALSRPSRRRARRNRKRKHRR